MTATGPDETDDYLLYVEGPGDFRIDETLRGDTDGWAKGQKESTWKLVVEIKVASQKHQPIP